MRKPKMRLWAVRLGSEVALVHATESPAVRVTAESTCGVPDCSWGCPLTVTRRLVDPAAALWTFCRPAFRRASGIKLKDGQVVEITVRQRGDARKARTP